MMGVETKMNKIDSDPVSFFSVASSSSSKSVFVGGRKKKKKDEIFSRLIHIRNPLPLLPFFSYSILF